MCAAVPLFIKIDYEVDVINEKKKKRITHSFQWQSSRMGLCPSVALPLAVQIPRVNPTAVFFFSFLGSRSNFRCVCFLPW